MGELHMNGTKDENKMVYFCTFPILVFQFQFTNSHKFPSVFTKDATCNLSHSRMACKYEISACFTGHPVYIPYFKLIHGEIVRIFTGILQ